MDSADEDDFISGLVETGERLCADVARMELSELEAHLPMVRIAVLYAAAYLYEHREHRRW
ncbi:head-tail connector protein [Lachnospiraceae bacterium 38-10]